MAERSGTESIAQTTFAYWQGGGETGMVSARLVCKVQGSTDATRERDVCLLLSFPCCVLEYWVEID